MLKAKTVYKYIKMKLKYNKIEKGKIKRKRKTTLN